jgi:hypothetical protein
LNAELDTQKAVELERIKQDFSKFERQQVKLKRDKENLNKAIMTNVNYL